MTAGGANCGWAVVNRTVADTGTTEEILRAAAGDRLLHWAGVDLRARAVARRTDSKLSSTWVEAHVDVPRRRHAHPTPHLYGAPANNNPAPAVLITGSR